MIIKLIRKHPLAAFFLLTTLFIGISLALNISGRFPAFGEYPLKVNENVVAVFRTRQTLINWMPNVIAFMVLGIVSGLVSVKKLLAQFFRWRLDWKTWLYGIGLPFLMAGTVLILFTILGGRANFDQPRFLLSVFSCRFLFSLSTESVGGEAGWRGFALVILQKRFHPLTASLMVGGLWGICHIPILTIRHFNVSELACFMLIILNLSVILTWLYNRSQSSLAAVCIFHSLVNALDATLSRSFVAIMTREQYLLYFSIIVFIVSVVVILTTKTRLNYQNERNT